MKKQKKKQIWKAAGALLLSVVLALFVPVSYLPTGLEAYAGLWIDENGFAIENGVLKKYIGTDVEIVIPEGVTSIGEEAFYGHRGLMSVSIPESVTSIGPFAFAECRGLMNISIPEGVDSIENHAFLGCVGLTSVSIPESVRSIGQSAFYDCSGLMSINISEGVRSIDYNAFSGCSGLTSISIPKSVTSIRENTFRGCSGLMSIVVEEGNMVYDSRDNCNAIIRTASNELITGCSETVIPEEVKSIGYEAFYGCSGLTSINIPKSVTSIGYEAFTFCSGLTNIVVEEGNAIYDSRGDCNAIIETESNILIAGCSKTVIPEEVTGIEYGAFSGRSGLTSIRIPSSVKSIGGGAFSGCSGLTSIVVEEGNAIYDSRGDCNAIIETESNTLIAGCSKTAIPESVTSIGYNAFSGCSGLMSISIPEGVTSIESGAFSGCSGLTSIRIPKSVTSIGYSVFDGCSGLMSIVVEEGNAIYDSRNNCNAIIETVSNSLIIGCCKTIIPEGVTDIGEGAFAFCSGLTSINIPEGVTNIGEGAFAFCSELTSISILSSVTSIEYFSFYACDALTIYGEEGSYTWKYAKLNNIPFRLLSERDDDIFEGDKFVIEDGVLVKYHGTDEEIVIPEGVTSIGNWVFENCQSLTSVTIPKGVTSIGDGTFSGCFSLTSITIPESVTSIGKSAFKGCDKLTIYGEKGSFAQTYAESNNISFLSLGGQEDDPNNSDDSDDPDNSDNSDDSDNILTLKEMTQLTEENRTQDTVIKTSNGLTFTFKKGAMELVDGVDSYDLGAKITEDYASLPNQAFAEEEFAFQIDYNYEGKLPGEAQITIPAGSEWAGQRLYYYEIKEDGTYSYVCKSTVAADGSYTVKQSQGGTYVATPKVPENLGDANGDGKITSEDALAVLKYDVKMAQEKFVEALADCDGEDGITSSDALEILKYDVKLISKFK